MKIILDVVLVEGTDKQQFVDSFDPESQADWWNMLTEIPNVISLNVEESFIEDLKLDSRVVSVHDRPQYHSADLPPVYSMTKTITSTSPSIGSNGGDYAPLQFYLDTNQISADSPPVGYSALDSSSVIPNATYSSRWTGKNVDIVTLEVGYNVSDLSPYIGYHDTHPDFDSLDNPGSSKMIPMDWVDLENQNNNQVANNSCMSAHGIGVLSAAAGTICGFAKRSSLRAAYITADDGTVEIINAITSWHNNKPVNPDTGVKNPTIMIAEYQVLRDRRFGINIEDITSIVDLNGTVNQPVSGWGTDFTPFTSRNIIPFQVYDPDTLSYVWCVVFPIQSRDDAQQSALRAAWDAGIVCINAAGNNGGVYVKETDPEYNGVYCTTSGNLIDLYFVQWNSSITKTTTTTATWYPFIPNGPHGEVKGIDVAAGYNSEANSVLDGYSNRGKGIDIVGLGTNTWTSYPATTYGDGFQWGMFSGTSCATPTVVGKAACLMERYFYYNGSWPTPDQVKTLLISSAKKVVRSVSSTDWSSVSSPDTQVRSIEGGDSLVRISSGANGNGGFKLTELAGTTNLRAFFDELGFNNYNTYGRRAKSGLLYPRPSSRMGNAIFPETIATPPLYVDVTVSSTSWVNNGSIPLKHAAVSSGGTNTSPQLSWTITGPAVADVTSYGVYVYEMFGAYNILWEVENIPSTTTSIAENEDWPAGVTITSLDPSQRSNGWYGPAFSAGSGTLNYTIFVVAYAAYDNWVGQYNGVINT